MENALPEKDYTVVNASAVTGNTANNSDKQTAVSGMMSQYSESVNNTLKVKSVFADNLGDAGTSEKETMLREEEQHLCTKNQETLLYYPYTPELRQL